MMVITIFEENKEFLSECFQALHSVKPIPIDVDVVQQVTSSLIVEWSLHLQKSGFGVDAESLHNQRILILYKKFIRELERIMLALSTANFFQSPREATMQLKRALARAIKKCLQDHSYTWENSSEDLENCLNRLDSQGTLAQYLISNRELLAKFNKEYVEWYQKTYQTRKKKLIKSAVSECPVVIHKSTHKHKKSVKEANRYIYAIKYRRKEIDRYSLEELKHYISNVEVENLFERAILCKDIIFKNHDQGLFFYTLYDELSEALFHSPNAYRHLLSEYVKRYRKKYPDSNKDAYTIEDDDQKYASHPECLSCVYAQARLEYLQFQKGIENCQTFAALREYCLSLDDKVIVGDNLIAKQIKPILKTFQVETEVETQLLPKIIKDKIKKWQESCRDFLHAYKLQRQAEYSDSGLRVSKTVESFNNSVG